MMEEESIIIGEMLSSVTKMNILDVCSSTYTYRHYVQPYIEANVFAPLKERDCTIDHLDAKVGRGVDIVADATDMPIEDNQYDVVICCSAAEHTTEPQKLVDECWRVLKEDGVLIFSVPADYPYHEDPIDTMLRIHSEDEMLQLVGGTITEFRMASNERGTCSIAKIQG